MLLSKVSMQANYIQSYMFFLFVVEKKNKKKNDTLALVCTSQDESTDLSSAAPAGAALRV